MGMLAVMRGKADAPDDVRFRSSCVWCGNKEYLVAHNMRIYTTENTFGITLIFCNIDHGDRFVETYDLTCVYDIIHDYCRRSVKSEGYTMKPSENIFDARFVKMNVDIDGTLRKFMVNCQKKRNVKEEKTKD